MNYYIMNGSAGLVIFKVEDHLAASFEKEYAEKVLVKGSSIAEVFTMFDQDKTKKQGEEPDSAVEEYLPP